MRAVSLQWRVEPRGLAYLQEFLQDGVALEPELAVDVQLPRALPVGVAALERLEDVLVVQEALPQSTPERSAASLCIGIADGAPSARAWTRRYSFRPSQRGLSNGGVTAPPTDAYAKGGRTHVPTDQDRIYI